MPYWPPVRLTVNGSVLQTIEGTVEILYDRTWGTICGDYWSLANSRVVCRMLGFNYVTASYQMYSYLICHLDLKFF